MSTLESERESMPWIDDSVWVKVDAARQEMSERQPKQTDAEAAERRAELDRQMAAEAEWKNGFRE